MAGATVDLEVARVRLAQVGRDAVPALLAQAPAFVRSKAAGAA